MSEQTPSRRQIVFNWLMHEDDFKTNTDGWWTGSEGVAYVDELLKAIDEKGEQLERELASARADAERYRARKLSEYFDLSRQLSDGHTTNALNHSASYDAHSDALLKRFPSAAIAGEGR